MFQPNKVLMKFFAIITILLFLICCFTSCEVPENEHNIQVKEEYDASSGSIHIQTITIDSLSHQYLIKIGKYYSGIAHYPECKYCKNKIN